MEAKTLPVYELPKVVTYTDEELLEELGPAQTGYVKGDSAFQAKYLVTVLRKGAKNAKAVYFRK